MKTEVLIPCYNEWVLCVPILAVMLTLCMAAPVNNEFRYAYSLFTCFPLLVTTPFVSATNEREHA